MPLLAFVNVVLEGLTVLKKALRSDASKHVPELAIGKTEVRVLEGAKVDGVNCVSNLGLEGLVNVQILLIDALAVIVKAGILGHLGT